MKFSEIYFNEFQKNICSIWCTKDDIIFLDGANKIYKGDLSHFKLDNSNYMRLSRRTK